MNSMFGNTRLFRLCLLQYSLDLPSLLLCYLKQTICWWHSHAHAQKLIEHAWECHDVCVFLFVWSVWHVILPRLKFYWWWAGTRKGAKSREAQNTAVPLFYIDIGLEFWLLVTYGFLILDFIFKWSIWYCFSKNLIVERD